MQLAIISKQCTKCKQVKDIAGFYKHRSMPDGYDYNCKSCQGKYTRKLTENRIQSGSRNIEEKPCSKCFTIKNKKEFYSNKSNADGLSPMCIICSKAYYKARTARVSSDIYGYFKLTINQLRARAKKHNREFEITIDDLMEVYMAQQGLCAITKVKLDYHKLGGRPSNRLSVDRTDNTKGYIKNNIQLICDAVNTMKGTLTMEELKEYCKLILENSK